MSNPSWADQLTAWSTLAYVVLTTVLATAAVATFYKVRQQLDEDRRTNRDQVHEMELARRSVTRPVIVLENPQPIPTGVGLALEFTVRNVGMGPCMRAEVDVWLLVDRDYDGSYPLPKHKDFAEEPPWGRLVWTAPIPVGGAEQDYVVAPTREAVLPLPDANKMWFIWARAKYWGVHGPEDFYTTGDGVEAVLYVAQDT